MKTTARALLAAMLLLPSMALAVPTLSFDNPTVDGGTLAYGGAGGAVTGTGIVFQEVIGVDTPLNAGVSLFCSPSPCLLDFTTGNNSTFEGPPIWTFAPGGSISMTGGLNTAADGSGVQVVPAGTALVGSGTFVEPGGLVLGAGASLQFTGQGTDTKDTTLSGFFGLANPFSFVTTELSLGGASINTETGAFSAIVTDADFQNTAAGLFQAPVPWPMTGLLVGLGLLGLTRRR